MKTLNKIKYLIIVLFTVFSINSFAQATGPGEPGGDPEGGGDPVGGGAPISGHTIVLLSFTLAYGGKKIYDFSKIKRDEIV
jgi:hypothetical protein